MSVPMKIDPEVARIFLKHAVNMSLDCPLPKKVKRTGWYGKVNLGSELLKDSRGAEVIRIAMQKPGTYEIYAYAFYLSDFHTFLEHHPEMKSKQLLWEMSNGTAS